MPPAAYKREGAGAMAAWSIFVWSIFVDRVSPESVVIGFRRPDECRTGVVALSVAPMNASAEPGLSCSTTGISTTQQLTYVGMR